MKNKLKVLLNENNEKNDLVIILPGGGYIRTSPREAIPVSDLLHKHGLHTAIYYYRNELISIDDILNETKTLFNDLFNNELINNIYLLGFSAGGHLAGILGEVYKDRLKGVAFAYPVVSSRGDIIHEGSFLQIAKERNNFDKFDLTNYIKSGFPSTFIFHTIEDRSVRVENSIILFNHLKSIKTACEVHFYQKGEHGMSIGKKEVAFLDYDKNQFDKDYSHQSNWANLLIKWIEMRSGEVND